MYKRQDQPAVLKGAAAQLVAEGRTDLLRGELPGGVDDGADGVVVARIRRLVVAVSYTHLDVYKRQG